MREVVKVELVKVGEVVNDRGECADCSTTVTQGKVFEGVLKTKRYSDLSDRLEVPGSQEQKPQLGERGEVTTEEVNGIRPFTRRGVDPAEERTDVSQ